MQSRPVQPPSHPSHRERPWQAFYELHSRIIQTAHSAIQRPTGGRRVTGVCCAEGEGHRVPSMQKSKEDHRGDEKTGTAGCRTPEDAVFGRFLHQQPSWFSYSLLDAFRDHCCSVLLPHLTNSRLEPEWKSTSTMSVHLLRTPKVLMFCFSCRGHTLRSPPCFSLPTVF